MEVLVLDIQADQGVVGLYPGLKSGHPEVWWTSQVALVEHGEVVNHSEFLQALLGDKEYLRMEA